MPIQPRREGSSSSSSFHVTKSGAEVGGRGREELDVAGVDSARERVEDEEEDDAELAFKWPRCGFWRALAAVEADEVDGDVDRARISSRLKGLRRARWASRASKQTRQCSMVAI